MFRKTVTTTGIMLGVWLAGVGILATAPYGSDNAGDTTVYPVTANVTTSYQEPGSKYTAYARTSTGANPERFDGSDY